jgi:hypothetical protein
VCDERIGILTFSGIKAIVMFIYNEFKQEIVDDIGREQVDAPIAGPVRDKLLVKFVWGRRER